MIRLRFTAIRRSVERMNRVFILALATVVAAAPIMFLNATATAQQITNRSVLISTAQSGATATYTFTFTPAQTNQVQSMTFQTCKTPLGACVAPTGVNLSGGTVSQSGFQGATSFTKDTTTNTANNGNCANADQ